jgi:DNA-binding transcriptional ArsR family regulator
LPRLSAEQAARLLSDPTRVQILLALRNGPASVSELVQVAKTTQSNVSNHLAWLRARGAVERRRVGRMAEYRLVDGGATPVIDALGALDPKPTAQRDKADLALARTCYDHLAGRLGVELFDALLAGDAITEPRGPRAEVDLGPRASAAFDSLGLPTIPQQESRRRFAFGCLDWTERRFHLGGSLGAASADRFLDAGWVLREPTGRALRVRRAAWDAVDLVKQSGQSGWIGASPR